VRQTFAMMGPVDKLLQLGRGCSGLGKSIRMFLFEETSMAREPLKFQSDVGVWRTSRRDQKCQKDFGWRNHAVEEWVRKGKKGSELTDRW